MNILLKTLQSCKNEENQAFLKIYGHIILAEIFIIIKFEENGQLQKTMRELENLQSDNTRIYEAVKNAENLPENYNKRKRRSDYQFNRAKSDSWGIL